MTIDPSPNRNEEPTETPPNHVFQPSTKDIVGYILIVLGIVLLFFQHIYGELLIGLVAGVYFSKEMLAFVRDFPQMIDEQGVARSLIIGGIILALFISAPAIFLGAAIVVCLRWFVFNEES